MVRTSTGRISVPKEEFANLPAKIYAYLKDACV
jgi:hypothetical protein